MGRGSDQGGSISRAGGVSTSALLVSAMAGALLGAAGLSWWLLREAGRRRQLERQARLLRLSRLQSGVLDGDPLSATLPLQRSTTPTLEREPLQDRVQQLNQAIEDVRRQLEQLQTSP